MATDKTTWILLAILVIVLIAGLSVIIYFAVVDNNGSSSGSQTPSPSSSSSPGDHNCVAIYEGFCSASAPQDELLCEPRDTAAQFHTENITYFKKTQELVDAYTAEGFDPNDLFGNIGDDLKAIYMPYNLLNNPEVVFRISKAWADSSYALTGLDRQQYPALFYAGYNQHGNSVLLVAGAVKKTVIDFNDVQPTHHNKAEYFGDVKVMHEANLTAGFVCP
jgi:hypothetical protein